MQVSWCKLEVEVTTPKSVMMASAEGQPQDVPPLVVAALNLKTRFNAQVPASTIPQFFRANIIPMPVSTVPCCALQPPMLSCAWVGSQRAGSSQCCATQRTTLGVVAGKCQ